MDKITEEEKQSHLKDEAAKLKRMGKMGLKNPAEKATKITNKKVSGGNNPGEKRSGGKAVTTKPKVPAKKKK